MMQPGGIRALAILSALVIALGSTGCSRPSSSTFRPGDIRDTGEAVRSAGPRLSNVASLPVDVSGKGTIQGTPTGEAVFDRTSGSFGLVLDPAPTGLPARTTVDVAIDRSTKAYRDGRPIGDPVESMGDDAGGHKADPSMAATVKVRYSIDNGVVLAERLDLSDVFPADVAP